MKSDARIEPTLTGLLADRRLLLILFVSLRLLLLFTYQPIFTQGIERGMSAGGDLIYYYQLVGMTDQGARLYPFQDWWSEFPPVPAFLYSGAYGLLGANANYSAFAMLLIIVMLVFDAGNLILVRAIGTRLHGAINGMAIAWVYALFAAPLIFVYWNFEPLVAFFFLLSLNALLGGKTTRSAVWAGIGALTKFTPALLLGAVWRFRKVRDAARFTGITVAVFGAVYAILFAQNAAMTLPSLTAQFNKASYQTVWALIDGNYRTGNFGTVIDHLDPERANDLQGNPAVISGIVRLAAAAAIGLFVFIRTRRFDDRGLVAFAAITLLIFFLQAQGWSPQWLAQIAPLMLLCFPTRDGVMGIVLLMVVTFAEYPFLWIRTGDTGGVISGALMMPFTVLVIFRTLILIAFVVALYRRLRQDPVPS